MDHGGHFEKDGSVMSQVQLHGGVDLCDNLPTSETLAALSQNLNDATSLAQAQSLSALQEAAGERREPVQRASLGGYEEVEGKAAGGDGEAEEAEDVDEEMMEEEEEETSEGSSVLIRCQSPDTPMTDSSYSETGSLLETPYPFSPGTSPEPTSSLLLPITPEVSCTTSQEVLSPSHVKVDPITSIVRPVASNPGSSTLEQSPGATSHAAAPSPPGPTADPHNADCQTFISGEHFTSSDAGKTTSAAETSAATSCSTSPTSSTTCTAVRAATTGLNTFASESTGIKLSSFSGAATSACIHYTSTPEPTGSSCSAGGTGPVGSPAPLESLQQLVQRGDDTHLPQYLHQIAETFVLNGDYQRALWCIQLERLYHQRVLDNLNALQQHWERQCGRSFPDLATTHLDTLKLICQTHSRPRAEHAPCASLDSLMSISEDRVEGRSRTAAHCLIETKETTTAEDFSHLESGRPLSSSHDSAARLDSPDTSEQKRDHLHAEPDGRSRFHGSLLTCTQRGGAEPGVGGGHVPSATGDEPHPPASGRMEQSKSAERQGGDVGRVQGGAAKEEAGESVREEETPAPASGMEDEGEDEEEEKVMEEDRSSVTAEPQVGAADVKEQQEAGAEEKLHRDSQDNPDSLLSQEAHLPQGEEEAGEEDEEEEEEEEEQYEVEQAPSLEATSLDDMAKLITVEEMSPASGLVSILKKRDVSVDDASRVASSEPPAAKTPPKRRVRFKVPDDGYEHEVGGGDSCLLLFLLCLVTVVISLGGTALYCALGDAHSSVCRDFSRNADFYVGQIQRGISHIQHWFSAGS